ncbi:MAG: hypothetical protein Q7T82_08160 [Armatimonadota bacterium]|nr:hypothetical protein [Armatimonadota bacterium]
MTERGAVGRGPVKYTDADGKLQATPLSDIRFDNGQLKDVPESEKLIEHLVKIGLIVPSEAGPPKPAMVIHAVDPGPAGDGIKITFSKVDVQSGTFDAVVTKTETHNALSIETPPSFIDAVLGTDANPLASPGLVHVKGAPSSKLPEDGSYPLKGGNASDASKVDVPEAGDPNAIAFTLEAKKHGQSGNHTTAKITVDSNSKTFKLEVTWEKEFTTISAADIVSKLDHPAYLIKVTEPPGGKYALPQEGETVVLSGGEQKVDAKPASATVTAR